MLLDALKKMTDWKEKSNTAVKSSRKKKEVARDRQKILRPKFNFYDKINLFGGFVVFSSTIVIFI